MKDQHVTMIICLLYIAALLVGGGVTLVNQPTPRLMAPVVVPLLCCLPWEGISRLMKLPANTLSSEGVL